MTQSRWSIRAWPRLAALALLLLCPMAAAAQTTTVYVIAVAPNAAACSASTCQPPPGVLMEIDVDHGTIASQTPISNAFGGGMYGFQKLAATPDGRYLVWIGGGGSVMSPAVTLNLFDRQTRTSTEVLRVPASPVGMPITTALFTHPTRLRAFAHLSSTPALSLDFGGIFIVPGTDSTTRLEGLTSDGGTLLTRQPGSASAALVSADSGAVEQTVSLPPCDVATLDATGANIFCVSGDTYSRVDTATSSVPAAQTVDLDGSVQTLTVDPESAHVFASMLNGWVRVLDADTLSPMALLAGAQPYTPYYPEPAPVASYPRLALDASGHRLFLLSTWSAGGPTFANSLAMFDTTTLQPVTRGVLPTNLQAVDIAVVPRPPQPSGLRATVDARRATLQWTPGSGPGLATGYVVEAGTGPGLANLVRFETGGAASLVVDGVPPGTYYVRVRGVNFEGTSAASEDIVVTVQ